MVKWAVLTLLGVGLATAAQAGEQMCIRESSGISHVVAQVPEPADCCTGRMQCSQYLSTTIVAHPKTAERT